MGGVEGVTPPPPCALGRLLLPLLLLEGAGLARCCLPYSFPSCRCHWQQRHRRGSCRCGHSLVSRRGCGRLNAIEGRVAGVEPSRSPCPWAFPSPYQYAVERRTPPLRQLLLSLRAPPYSCWATKVLQLLAPLAGLPGCVVHLQHRGTKSKEEQPQGGGGRGAKPQPVLR